IAPGCGAEDFDLGKRFSLSEICPVDDAGVFLEGYDFLSGKAASGVAQLVFEKLLSQGKLFKTHEYTHSYPVCWRCKTEVLFRLVDEWYIKTDEIRPKLVEEAKKVKWEQPFIGKRMVDWLNNMEDWNISRKRFYGLPLPFYPCKSCGHLNVIGSKDELISLGGVAVRNLPELHRPWIDDVKIRCERCGELVSRVPEVGDVWLDAGIVPFSTLGYFTDKEKWEKNFPAEWIIEMQEQVRLWFYSQLFMSVTITGKAPYERVSTNNWVIAEDGTKFSKTGFMIPFDEAAEKMGSDAIRYLFASASMANDVRFGYGLLEEVRRKLLNFWNIYTFFNVYGEIDNPSINEQYSDNLLDMWLKARTADFIDKAVKCYESYNTQDLIREFEACVDDISNWYVRTNRRRFWKDSLDDDKQNAYNTLYHAIKSISQVMAPILPFMTEHIWQNMVLLYEKEEESIHLSTFPISKDFDDSILDEVLKVRGVINKALKLRNEKNIKVKQPLSTLYLSKDDERVVLAYAQVIKDELNIKEIEFLDDFDSLNFEYLSLNFQVAGKNLKGDLNKVKAICDKLGSDEQLRLINDFKQGKSISLSGFSGELPVEYFSLNSKGKENIARSMDGLVAVNVEITPSLKREGIYREILRQCQLLRKEAGFNVSDRVYLGFTADSMMVKSVLDEYADNIARETLSQIKDIDFPLMQKKVSLDDGEVIIFIK
ncbi:MAG: class I tRNA ligase family protein, partial [Oscillospiraceae bacterium]|nr:class I tRNA ligase family protein [Oscillospiraceae bacterium]